MLKYHFTKKLLPTRELLKELSIKISTLDFWKTQWRKSGNDCWEMGLRIIGKTAYWDPIIFLDWVNTNKLKNKPKDLRDPNLVLFVSRNSTEVKEYGNK